MAAPSQAALTAPGMGPAAQSLPPLPDLGANGTGAAPGGPQGLAAMVAGLAPVKSAVDAILAACKGIVQSNAVPGAETVCSQIVALATSLLPLAAQQAMVPGGTGPQAGPIGQ